MGLEGFFIGLDFELRKMKFLYIPLIFVGKMPASNILYRILWVQEDERRARIVNPAEKIMVAVRIEPMTSRWKTST